MLPTSLSRSLTDELIIVQVNWDIDIDIAIDIPVDLIFIKFLVFQRNSKDPLGRGKGKSVDQDRIGWFLFESEMEPGGKPYKYLSSRRVLHHPEMAASVFLAEHHKQSFSL